MNGSMRAPVSYLFVPGNRPERFSKAVASGADAVIIDLEDAVAPADKAAARAAFADWHARRQAPTVPVYLRVNAADSPYHGADVDLLANSPGIGVMVPKAEDPAAFGRAMRADPRRPAAIALIETVAGFDALDALAAVDGVGRLAFGELDYLLDIDATGAGAALAWPMTAIVHASRRAGLVAPIAGVTTSLDDEAAINADVMRARAFGFGAKLCIHPRQVAVVHAAFAPTPAELDWARRVLAAVDGGAMAAQVDGRMVDRPVVLRAQALLARARPAR